jgi:predicted membrane protein
MVATSFAAPARRLTKAKRGFPGGRFINRLAMVVLGFFALACIIVSSLIAYSFSEPPVSALRLKAAFEAPL